MITRNQLLGDLWIIDTPADAVGDIVRKFLVGCGLEERFGEIGEEQGKSGFVVQLVPGLASLFRGERIEATAIGDMLEATWRDCAVGEDLLVTAADFSHLGLVNLAVIEGNTPVRTALKDGEFANLRSQCADELDRRCAGPNDAHPLVA